MKSSERLSLRQRAGAFTLVELLVAIAILILIMLAVSQLMNSTIAVTVGSFKHMDADTQARVVLDRIALDVFQNGQAHRTSITTSIIRLRRPTAVMAAISWRFIVSRVGIIPSVREVPIRKAPSRWWAIALRRMSPPRFIN